MEGRLSQVGRTALTRYAAELHTDVQLMREFHWTYEDLLNCPDDVIWAATQILSFESAKMERENKRYQ